MVSKQDAPKGLIEMKELEPEPESPFLDEAAFALPTREEAWDSYEAEPEPQLETPFASAFAPTEQENSWLTEEGLESEIEPEELEGLGDEPEEETEQGWVEGQVPPAPPPQCGFHGPNGVFVTEADLRSAVANAALDERKKWWDSTSRTFQKEVDGQRFGDLVRYWLAGLRGPIRIPPGKLEALQQAALSPSVPYRNLGNPTLNLAISVFLLKEARVGETTTDVYNKSDAVDSVRRKAKATVTEMRAAQAALDKAMKADFKEAKIERDKQATLVNWEDQDRQNTRKKLLTTAGGTHSQDIEKVVDEALKAAHRSRADIEAWSAVFVVSCVRAAAIGRKLEAMDRGKHGGRDGLLLASNRHWEYVLEARNRERKAVGGTYHAFGPGDRVVQIGDIICTDRTNFISKPVALKDLKSRNLHCDIVTSIEPGTAIVREGVLSGPFAMTIGGNVQHAVRRRRYPLDPQGKLVVSRGQLFAQEDDKGAFAPFETRVLLPTMLPPASTCRILALLSPVCKPVLASAGKRPPAGKRQEILSRSAESLESPFLNAGILPTERRNQFDSGVERLAEKGPFLNALEERVSRFDEDQLEEEEEPDELEGVEELDSESNYEEERMPLQAVAAQPELETFEGFEDAELGDDEFEHDEFEDDAEASDRDIDSEFAEEAERVGEETEYGEEEETYGLEVRELDPVLVDLAEKIFAREFPLVEQQVSLRWTRCFSAEDIAKVQKVYQDNAAAASSNSGDRCSCIVMLNVALGQLLPLPLKQHPTRSGSTRFEQMADLTTKSIEKSMRQLRRKGFAISPWVTSFFDRRNRTAGTLKPERLKASVRDKVLANSKKGGCWFAFAMSVLDGYHSVLLLVDHTAVLPSGASALAKIFWLDQFSTGRWMDADVTNSLDQRITDKTRDFWQRAMDERGKGYDTTIRLWQLRKTSPGRGV